MLQRKRIRGATSIRHRRARGGDDDDDVDERRPDDAKAKSFYRLPSTSTGATTTTTMPASSTCEGGEQKITPDSKCPPRLPSRFRWGGREQSVHTSISTSTSREVGTRKRSRPNLITARRSVAGPQLDSRVLRAARDMSGEFSGREPFLSRGSRSSAFPRSTGPLPKLPDIGFAIENR